MVCEQERYRSAGATESDKGLSFTAIYSTVKKKKKKKRKKKKKKKLIQ